MMTDIRFFFYKFLIPFLFFFIYSSIWFCVFLFFFPQFFLIYEFGQFMCMYGDDTFSNFNFISVLSMSNSSSTLNSFLLIFLLQKIGNGQWIFIMIANNGQEQFLFISNIKFFSVYLVFIWDFVEIVIVLLFLLVHFILIFQLKVNDI